jgi:hypothetical protein
MTRDEQIIEASHNYGKKLNEEAVFDYEDMKCAFKEGAMWADKHCDNVWHNASEEPRLNQWFIAQIGDDAFDTFVMDMDRNQDWQDWSKGFNIKRWAYICDLLPKGGKL